MHELLSSFLSNESRFGRIMTRCGIIMAANLLFILFSLPVVTTGAALTALYHVMFKTLRGDGVINPFVQFWNGFRANFKQATLAWLLCGILCLLGWADVRICLQAGGWVGSLRYAVYGLGAALFIVTLYLFPTMAAFDNTLPNLARSGVYFALRKPLKLAVNLFFHAFPLFLTYTDAQYQPLYAFLWATFGFGAVGTKNPLFRQFQKEGCIGKAKTPKENNPERAPGAVHGVLPAAGRAGQGRRAGGNGRKLSGGGNGRYLTRGGGLRRRAERSGGAAGEIRPAGLRPCLLRQGAGPLGLLRERWTKLKQLSRQHRLFTRAEKLCLDEAAADALHISARKLEVDLVLQGVEHLLGLREGRAPGEVADFYRSALGVTLTEEQYEQGRRAVQPKEWNVYFQDFDNRILQLTFSEPENWGMSMAELEKLADET